MARCGWLLALTFLAQPGASAVVPVYRDLLKATPFSESAYDGLCGAGAGPFEILRTAPSRQAAALVRDLDAGEVINLAERALSRASTALPGATVTVCLFPGELSRGLPYLGGVGGVSLGAGHIKLVLHPGPGQLRRVSYTVTHEYHHEAERSLGPGGPGPIDILVREGKADYFAVTMYPELRPPHTQPLSSAERHAAWRALLDHEQAQTPPAAFRSDFMIGTNPRVTPWPGYRLAYEMVE